MATRQDTAYDVFISHSSRDKTVADAVCAALEQAGTRCWIAPRDIRPGEDWGASIVEGIRHSRAMVLVFSSNTNASGHIPREVEQAVKQGVTVIPFRIEEVVPKGSLDYNLSSVHWLDALTPPLENHIGHLVDTVAGFLGRENRAVSPSTAATLATPLPPAPPTPAARRSGLPGWLVPASAVVVVGAAAVWGYAFFSGRDQTAPSALTAPSPDLATQPPVSPPASTAVPTTLTAPGATPAPSATTTAGPRTATSEPSTPPAPARAPAATTSPAAPAPAAATAAPLQDVPSRPPVPAPGVEAQAQPAADAALAAELRQLRRRFAQLQARRDAAFGTIDTLEQQQRAAGAGLRRDIVLARQTVELQLQDADAALGAQSSSEASQALDLAERQIETLERFVGR